jgi:predicted acyltransferase
MFLLGVITQGGISFMEYNLQQIRVMGILQRVALCYYVVALMEIFLPRFDVHPSTISLLPNARPTLSELLAVFRRYPYHWLGGLLLVASHTAVLYGVDVPSAFGEVCGRGVLTPPCNAATYVDSLIFTPDHMYFPANGGKKGKGKGKI